MKQNKKGDILIPAVLLLLILVVLGLALMSMTLSSANLSSKSQSAQQAYYSAKSVTDEVASLLISNEDAVKTQHDALLAQVWALHVGGEASSAVTLTTLPGKDASLTISCTKLDDSKPNIVVKTFKIWAQVTVDTYVRSVSRLVTITEITVTENGSAAGLVVNDAKASVAINGNVQGSAFIQNAAKVTMSGDAPASGVEVNGNLYVNTANNDTVGAGTIDASAVTVNGNAVLVSRGAVTLTNQTNISNAVAAGGNLYVNTSKTDGQYYNVNATNTTISGETIVLNSENLTFDAVNAQVLHINATTDITLKNGTVFNSSGTTLAAAHGAVSINDGAWSGSTSPYAMPAGDTTEDVFKAENALAASDLINPSKTAITLQNGTNSTLAVHGVMNVELKALPNGGAQTLPVTGAGTLNIFLDPTVSDWQNLKNVTINTPAGGGVIVNIIYQGTNTLEIRQDFTGVQNANYIVASGNLRVADDATVDGTVLFLSSGNLEIAKDATVGSTAATADFSAAFSDAAATKLATYIGSAGVESKVYTFALGNYKS